MAIVTKSPTRESLPHRSEQSQPRHRNVYDYDGEYEFHTVRHWTAPAAGPVRREEENERRGYIQIWGVEKTKRHGVRRRTILLGHAR